MNAATTARTYPIDRLLICGNCGAGMKLEYATEPCYACPNGCAAPQGAEELNRTIIGGIIPAVVTGVTFPALKAAATRALVEIQVDHPDLPDQDITDKKIRARLINPDTMMAEDQVEESAGLLGMFIERIEVRPGQVTVRYAMALPPGSPAAGSQSQEIELPVPATE